MFENLSLAIFIRCNLDKMSFNSSSLLSSDISFGRLSYPENLIRIQEAMLHPDFIKLMTFSNGNGHRYNHKVIRLFRKDFWKEFLK